MTGSPFDELIDSVGEAVLAPQLDGSGFQRRRRIWHLLTRDALRVVALQVLTPNATTAGRFRIEVGLAFPRLGEAKPPRLDVTSCSHNCLLVLPGRSEWGVRDATSEEERSALLTDVADAWEGTIWPCVESWGSPGAYRDHLLAWTPPDHTLLLEAAELSRAMSEPDKLDESLRAALASLAADDAVPPPSPAVDAELQMYHLAVPYARVFAAMDGSAIRADDFSKQRGRRALEAMQRVSSTIGPLPLSEADRICVKRLGDELGLDMTDTMRELPQRSNALGANATGPSERGPNAPDPTAAFRTS